RRLLTQTRDREVVAPFRKCPARLRECLISLDDNLAALGIQPGGWVGPHLALSRADQAWFAPVLPLLPPRLPFPKVGNPFLHLVEALLPGDDIGHRELNAAGFERSCWQHRILLIARGRGPRQRQDDGTADEDPPRWLRPHGVEGGRCCANACARRCLSVRGGSGLDGMPTDRQLPVNRLSGCDG